MVPSRIVSYAMRVRFYRCFVNMKEGSMKRKVPFSVHFKTPLFRCFSFVTHTFPAPFVDMPVPHYSIGYRAHVMRKKMSFSLCIAITLQSQLKNGQREQRRQIERETVEIVNTHKDVSFGCIDIDCNIDVMVEKVYWLFCFRRLLYNLFPLIW